MKIKVTAIACGAILGLSSTSLLAEDENTLSYNTVGVEYVYNRLDASSDGDVDGNLYFNGYEINGSYALFDRVLFHGRYYDGGDADVTSDVEVDYDSIEIGVSALNIDNDNVGLDGGLLWRQDDFGNDADNDLKGIGFGFGVRGQLFENHELGVRFGVYFGDFDDSVGIKVNYAYNILDYLAITTGYEYFDASLDGDDPDDFDYTNHKLSLGVRYSF